MKLIKQVIVSAITAALALAVVAPAAWAGAEHHEFPLALLDYNDCTGEEVLWDVVVKEIFHAYETPSGQAHILSKWLWEGTVEGLDSGHIWMSKGVSPYVERFSLENSLTGGFVLIENSILKPVTPGAPRIKLDVNIRLAFNANGDLVVDRATYTYDCR